MQVIGSIAEIADRFGAIVLDQWGVLHDGTAPYPAAIDTLVDLKARGRRLAVLSNSGKRADVNRARIASMGFPASLFDCVMTSGEALWLDVAAGRVPQTRFFPITRDDGDAEDWAEGLSVTMTRSLEDAEAVLLMGLRDGAEITEVQPVLDAALSKRLPIYCSNPDRASPRSNGRIVVSPGAVAHQFESQGGDVRYYGKPYKAVFQAVERALDLPPAALLMVGDSLEHDIAGAQQAGWSTLFVRGGLLKDAFGSDDPAAVLAGLAETQAMPDYSVAALE